MGGAKIRFLLGMWCACAVLACSRYPHVIGEHIVHNEIFDYRSLAGSGVTVLVVTSVFNDSAWRDHIEPAMTERLERRLRFHRKDLKVTPTGDVVAIMTPEGTQAVVSSYAKEGALALFHLKALRKLLMPETRYVILARVEQYGLETKTHLKAILSFTVYDLSSGEVAWGGFLRTVKEITYETNATSDADFQILYGHPATEFWSMMDGVYKKFADSLPKP